MISIVINCFKQNDKNSISKTMQSLKGISDLEIIILNGTYDHLENVSFIEERTFEHALAKCLNIIHGDYFYILDAGDCFYKDSFIHLQEVINKNEYDLIHFNVLDHKNNFQIEKSYQQSSHYIYQSTKVNALPIKLKGIIIKSQLFKDIQLIKPLDHSFELDILSQIYTLKELKCYKDSSCILELYNGSDLLSFDVEKGLSIFLNNLSKLDKLNVYQEYLALNELKRYLLKSTIKYNEDHLSDSDKDNFLNQIHIILGKISLDMIRNMSSIVMPYKNYLLDLKYGSTNKKYIQFNDKKAYIYYCGQPVLDIASVGYFKINVLESKHNILILDGVDMFSFLSSKYKLFAVDNENHYYTPQLFKWTLQDRKGFVGEKVFEGRRFRFEIPLNGIKHIRFVLRKDETDFELNPSFGNFGKIIKKYKMSFFAKDNYIFQYRKKGISIRVKTKKSLMKTELKFWLQLIKAKRIDMVFLRLAYYIMNSYYKKPVWLMRDNEKRAKDSGAEMFKYFSKWDKKDDYYGYFILDRNCSDYAHMKKYGKIIQPESFKYRLYHLLAHKLIDTRGSITPQYVFKDDYVFVAGLCDWDYIWLIHGIMTRNESTWTNKYAINAKLFATCNIREYQSVLDEENGYGYSKKEVALTGLPRHDALNAHKQKKILFLPTWRKHLAGDLIPGTSDRSYVDNFRDSDFFQFYNSLINDSRLLRVMKEKGYTGDFYLHPSFMKQCHDFDENDLIYVGKEPADTNELIGQCCILLTDYSSAQFEGAYLDTPVIYPQYDADTFSDNHTGQEGYFDYEKDGFGPVCYDLDATVNAIIKYIDNDCVNEEPYKSRAKDFFKYHDHHNSERVFNEILKIDDSYDDSQLKIINDEENTYLYCGDILKNAVKHEDNYRLYNPLFHLNSYVNKIEMMENSFLIDACLIVDEHDFKLPHHTFQINIGPYTQNIQFIDKKYKHNQIYYHFQMNIDYKDILLTKKSTPVYIVWQDNDKYGYRGYLKYQFAKRNDSLANKKKRKFHYSNVHIFDKAQSSIFFRETMGNNVYLCVRDINVTDTFEHQKLLKKAYRFSKLFWFHKAKDSILLFEKFASKYEESASVLFEKLIDEGYKNVYFIIDKNSIHYQNIPSKYKKFVIDKYSFKHYFYFFMSRKFISTESMNHCIELNIADPNVTLKITKGAYDYIFLQHGVMYMYCLENRSDFIKGQGFTKNSKIVVSSQTEANHFMEYGLFNQNDLIISGLPKFDRNTRNSDADKILIMPTSRDFEYNVIRLTPTESTYYRFVKNIIEEIPDELKDKIVVVGHPLLKDQLESTDLKKYMPTDYVYDDLLKDTKLLITDYSSISYDAFYRGCNVIFCWEDKEMCLSELGYKLMLNDDNVFSDVSYNFNDLSDLVMKNYFGEQSQEHITKYHDIVTYHDTHNTQRCYDALKKQGYLDKQPLSSIRRCTIKNLTKKVYSGDKRIHTQLEIYDHDKLLVRNRDYQVFYFNNKRKGKFALLLIVGRGRYFGFKLRRFKIVDTIMNYSVFGVRYSDNDINLDHITLCNKNGHYLKKDIDFKVEENLTKLKHVSSYTIQGIKKYAGKITLLFYKQ